MAAYLPAVCLWLLVCLLSSAGAVRDGMAIETLSVRAGGMPHLFLEQRTAEGALLRRFSGFGRVADLAVYDASTVLVVEPDFHRISALGLDGTIRWETPVRQPLRVTVLDADRLLVCQDHPPAVVEITRAGDVLFTLPGELSGADGAARLPDGNYALVESRLSALRVVSPSGEELWRATHQLQGPRDLALLTTGELAVSGFDYPVIMIFTPYTDRWRSVDLVGHCVSVAALDDGGVMGVSPEQQYVRGYGRDGRMLWNYATLYAAEHGAWLPDGSTLISVLREPSQACMNAALRARRPRRLAAYWFWLGAGLLGGGALVLAVQGPRLWGVWRDACDAPPAVGATEASLPLPRRLELALYALGIVGVAAAAAFNHNRLLQIGQWQPFWWYAGIIGAGGLLLALLQHRLPAVPGEWTVRMSELSPMARPRWNMWLLWALALICAAVAAEAVWSRRGEWPAALWLGGIILWLGGSLERAPLRLPHGRRALWWAAGGALWLAFVFGVRLYRLEQEPANVHLDMAQWSTQVFQLLDGETPTLFANGWAEIPMLGYLWSALWTAAGGRTLFACRLASATAGGIAIVAAYFLARRLFGARVALWGSLLLAANHGFLHFSRIQAYMDPIPFHVLALLALVAGIERGRYGWFALAGASAGYSALTYHAGRISPIALVLLGAMIVLRYPRVLVRRWQGLALTAAVLAVTVSPQAVLYAEYYAGISDQHYPFGRNDQYEWAAFGRFDGEKLKQTLRDGTIKVLGSIGVYPDSSTQYGRFYPLLFPLWAALAWMAVVAALLRPRDIRGVWIVAWALLIYLVGGILTRDPPFWPRFVTAFVPICFLAVLPLEWLCRAGGAVAGRVGMRAAFIAACVLVGYGCWQQLHLYTMVLQGIPWGETRPVKATEWEVGIIGRDIQRQGPAALYHIVAANMVEYGCSIPVLAFYGYEADIISTREIGDHLPFTDPRTVVCYILPERSSEVAAIQRLYPRAEVETLRNNLGAAVCQRVIVRAPHAPATP